MTDPATADLDALDDALFPLMLRNIATEGFPFTDPRREDAIDGMPAVSRPGAIIASPSYRVEGGSDDPRVDQDYVYNWVRDAALTIAEVAARGDDPQRAEIDRALRDYVSFARRGQEAARATPDGLAVACQIVDGRPRPGWPAQNDGPALQGIALLCFLDRLDDDTRGIAVEVIRDDAAFVVERWRQPNTNLWEEVAGHSFFTRSVQLRLLETLIDDGHGIPVPDGAAEAVAGLRAALDEHWDADRGCYLSVLEAQNPRAGYDPNIDIVLAAIVGAVPVTDPRVLATAALLRAQWAGPPADASGVYPINVADAGLGIGPVLGRYPGDVYDGDDTGVGTGHPWFVATAGFAELHYRLANRVEADASVPVAPPSFWAQIDADPSAGPAAVVAALRAAGDRMLRAVVRHSDGGELSEQLDATTGFQRSVSNLTWSYAAVLSALRARGGSSAGPTRQGASTP